MTHTLDISGKVCPGKVCPVCLLTVDKELKKLSSGEDLVVVCDHAPAATASIPEYCGDRHFGCYLTSLKNRVPI